MKFILVTIVAALAVQAQAPTPQNAQAAETKPTTEVQPDVVVAVVNGMKVTADDVKHMVANIPPQMQQAFANDPQQFMREYAWYKHTLKLAEKAGLDQQSPYKERLEFQKMLTLTQAMWDKALTDVTVTRDEELAYYKANELKYKEVQAKLIYIPFGAGASGTSGKKILTEAEAKAKAESVAKQARAGGDFIKLVKENSEDPGSVAQNGDIGVGIRSTTTHIPEPMRNAILALTAGQISDAIRHDNGYYVFRAESVGVLPYEKVRDEIYKELKQAGFRRWQQKTQSESAVQFANEEFFRSFAKDVQKQNPK